MLLKLEAKLYAISPKQLYIYTLANVLPFSTARRDSQRYKNLSYSTTTTREPLIKADKITIPNMQTKRMRPASATRARIATTLINRGAHSPFDVLMNSTQETFDLHTCVQLRLNRPTLLCAPFNLASSLHYRATVARIGLFI